MYILVRESASVSSLTGYNVDVVKIQLESIVIVIV